MSNKLEPLSEYDRNKLKEAYKLITEVYEYNFTPSSRLAQRLDTICQKLASLINEA